MKHGQSRSEPLKLEKYVPTTFSLLNIRSPKFRKFNYVLVAHILITKHEQYTHVGVRLRHLGPVNRRLRCLFVSTEWYISCLFIGPERVLSCPFVGSEWYISCLFIGPERVLPCLFVGSEWIISFPGDLKSRTS